MRRWLPALALFFVMTPLVASEAGAHLDPVAPVVAALALATPPGLKWNLGRKSRAV